MKHSIYRYVFIAFTFFAIGPLSALAYPSYGHQAVSQSGRMIAGGILFDAPDAWKQAMPSSSMRLFEFQIPPSQDEGEPAELAVFHFGQGMGGDVNANIERWKAQFSSFTKGFQPELEKRIVHNIAVTTIYIEGTIGSRIPGMPQQARSGYAVLGAIAEGPKGPVFFKMMGPKKTVQSARAGFSKFVDSFRSE